MSLLVYQTRTKKDKERSLMETGFQKQEKDSWVPETPAKPSPTRPQRVYTRRNLDTSLALSSYQISDESSISLPSSSDENNVNATEAPPLGPAVLIDLNKSICDWGVTIGSCSGDFTALLQEQETPQSNENLACKSSDEDKSLNRELNQVTCYQFISDRDTNCIKDEDLKGIEDAGVSSSEIQRPNGRLTSLEFEDNKDSVEDESLNGELTQVTCSQFVSQDEVLKGTNEAVTIANEMASSSKSAAAGDDLNELHDNPCKNIPTLEDTIQESQFDNDAHSQKPATLLQCDDVEVKGNGKKRKKEFDERPQKKPKKYWPKVLGQGKPRKAAKPKVSGVKRTPKPKREGECKPQRAPKQKASKSVPLAQTPQPCTPEQNPYEERRYVDSNENNSAAATPARRWLNFIQDSNSIVMYSPPTGYQSGCGVSSQVTNVLGCQYNSLQVYHKTVFTLCSQCLCLTRSRQIGPNFPEICRKKRIQRWKPNLGTPLVAIVPSFPVICKKKRIQKWKPTFEARLIAFKSSMFTHSWSVRRGKRSKTCIKRRSVINLIEAPICNQDSRSFFKQDTTSEVRENGNCYGYESHTNEEKRVENRDNLTEKSPTPEYNEMEAPDNSSQGSNEMDRDKWSKGSKMEEAKGEISNSEMTFLLEKFKSLDINDDLKIRGREKTTKRHSENAEKTKRHNELVLYKEPEGELVLYKKRRKPYKSKIKIDEETLRVWNLLMDGKTHQETDEEKRKYWERERDVYRSRVDSFISRMHLILGDRRFSPWKGSVLDSVNGVFLTQNVSDHLSSSAFMSLAATFPVARSGREHAPIVLPSSLESKIEVGVLDSQESTVSNLTPELSDHPSNLDNNGNENLSKKKKPDPPGMIFGKRKSTITKKMNEKEKEEQAKKEEQEATEDKQYWDNLRETCFLSCKENSNHMDSVDWEAVRRAKLDEVAEAIKVRGQHKIIAQRIQAFLNKLMEMHGSLNLEWLRHAPSDKVKEYLLKVYGLGLKSVECIRLLALQHTAFPVDVNVGRIAVRLGWVPLEPLPESVQIHLLDQFPLMDVIQQYLWPRLCTLDQRILYELHYQLITFGKVFCTKKNPNCNACPMRGECKHFASAYASAKKSLPGPVADKRPTDEGTVTSAVVHDKSFLGFNSPSNGRSVSISEFNNSSATEQQQAAKQCEPIVEMPTSPERACTDSMEEEDIENFYQDDDGDDDLEEIPTIKLNEECCTSKTQNSWDEDNTNMSRALVALSLDAKSIPVPKLKNVTRLRTERLVYVLPDTHPLLEGLEKRNSGDPSPYLLVIWSEGEFGSSSESAKNMCNDNASEENSLTVPGTLLIPCRTAMRDTFPLNGTYFQVNEVFADHHSSISPINVPRKWLWNLPTRIAYFGTSTSTILRGLQLEKIQYCFWKGFVCVRGFDRITRAPKPLSVRFHQNTTSKSKSATRKAQQQTTQLRITSFFSPRIRESW